ncbi:hypothetical protein CEY11_16215 [Candidimonas nitroreducens]|uniref:Uncharacterized protein n=1 Tax=Candidimonas nitroreducens TaxID=683354 RepID=A0A225M7Z3_9BURK|nr:hypothetical protein CEY11_16215 [Candidimonas nitroreducens]
MRRGPEAGAALAGIIAAALPGPAWPDPAWPGVRRGTGPGRRPRTLCVRQVQAPCLRQIFNTYRALMRNSMEDTNR